MASMGSVELVVVNSSLFVGIFCENSLDSDVGILLLFIGIAWEKSGMEES